MVDAVILDIPEQVPSSEGALWRMARELHPAGAARASSLVEPAMLSEIAAGLAAAHRGVVPLGEQLLLETDCYEAWLVAVPAHGRCLPAPQGGGVAVQVTAGELVAIWPWRASRLGAGSVVVDASGRAPLLVNETARRAIIVAVIAAPREAGSVG